MLHRVEAIQRGAKTYDKIDSMTWTKTILAGMTNSEMVHKLKTMFGTVIWSYGLLSTSD